MGESNLRTLREIAPLRYRLRDGWEIVARRGRHYAICAEDGRQFSLRPWQEAMLRRFDGRRSFKEVASEVHAAGGGFTSAGLLNFYRWLDEEDLVFCLCDSVFELVDPSKENAPARMPTPKRPPGDRVGRADGREAVPGPAAASGRPRTPPAEPVAAPSIWNVFVRDLDRLTDRLVPRTPRQWTGVKLAASVLLTLAALRIAYVAAPVFEPPMNYAYAGLERYFADRGGEARSLAKQSTEPQAGPVKEFETAGKAQPGDAGGIPEPGEFVGESPRNEDAHAASEGAALARKRADLQRIEVLRQKMLECRIRRDEFYLQNNEPGYREEVAAMTEIAREIGEIEARL